MNLKDVLGNPDHPQNNFAKDIIALRYGGLTSLALIAFFIIASILGYSNLIALSAFNIIFFIVGIFFALKSYAGTAKSNSIEYFDGIKLGLYTGFVAAVLLSFFVGVYLEANQHALNQMNTSYFWGQDLVALEIAVVALLEGLPTAFIATLVCMQYFKKD
jgi:hypothetical protein